jgi:hypothetical protein
MNGMSSEQQPDTGDQIVQIITEAVETASRAIVEWAERNRPAFAALTEIASSPEALAMIERAQTERAERRPCYCLCGKLHPGEHVCDGQGITTRQFIVDTERFAQLGPVDVWLCAPCAVAQGVRELAGP